ncbi:L-lactate dehydrogenase [Aureobasidium pullulans]|uniref:L-lactate dehydrogenase (cytochrome) n=1 Tax=Aureobasidium pullulans TaxID=5580 RepID=A0A4S9KU45_AURPU|nr:L-lactate dehydrogenase [Aureobasidium pullulans]THW01940.1 L-lactate dehydrogenase [Aureobasidium pullulans]THW22741.1 L-lactate dehydrogenase [Aureobasidium pullulans]THW40473.1 L-lactate dehydrogenase [Aureobasidium pullulans]THW65291.1 L-lactate dehydrogenase [Aureobasidium pullulans]
MATIDGTELAKHNNRQSCWLAVHGEVWDATNFLDQHPGGANLILKLAGKDASDEYDLFHSPELVEETLGSKARKGTVDISTIPKMVKKSELGVKTGQSQPLSSMISVNDFELAAEKTMTPTAWAYISSGADDEISMRENANAYRKIFLRGRVLRKVARVDCSTNILGYHSALPIYTSPVGLAKLVHPSGECAIATAAGKEDCIQVVNTVSSMPIEDIMDARVSKNQVVFWQLYADKDLEKSKTFVRRVEKAGVAAIWLTVDSPVVGNRERDERSKSVVDIEEEMEKVVETTQSVGIAKASTGFINADLNWEMIDWLRKTTKLPIVIKGIQSVEDAVSAFHHKVDGIVLSNHGGRSQDTAQPPLLTLLEIDQYAPNILGKHMQVFVDGGIRRGTDIIKALALGATAVGIGRPVLYSMSGGYGEHGVRRMVQILRNELQTNMAFIGASNVGEIERGMINTRSLERMLVGSVKL